MAISLAVKSVIGVGTAGCVASSVIGVNYWLFNKGLSILELVKSKNPDRRLLNEKSSDKAWVAAWKAYREANKTKERDIWSVKGWVKEGTITDVAAPEDFKRTCESKINGSSDSYDEVISYCTRKTVFADLIGEDSGRKLLAKVTGGNTPEWRTVWSEYKKSDATHTNGKDAWNLDNWASEHTHEHAPEVFMNKCQTNSETEGYDPDVQLYRELLEYCTVKQ